MKQELTQHNNNKTLAALRALGKNIDYTVAELAADKGMVVFINGVPVIPFITVNRKVTAESVIKPVDGNV
ncbi:hypothetical protein AAKU52_001963 [Pedobacter sp. CG_S7]|uniref:hypothetical protein n=1 Tax=Pedobacter sp. CG_S7 TaxID=3143930 RepID=UPI003391B0BE